MGFLSQTEIPKIGTSITFDFRRIMLMVLAIVLSTIIIIVLILFELNLIVEYLLGLHLKTTHRRVPIGQMKFMTVFNIENIFFIHETQWIINNQQKPNKNSRLKSLIPMEQLS